MVISCNKPDIEFAFFFELKKGNSVRSFRVNGSTHSLVFECGNVAHFVEFESGEHMRNAFSFFNNSCSIDLELEGVSAYYIEKNTN